MKCCIRHISDVNNFDLFVLRCADLKDMWRNCVTHLICCTTKYVVCRLDYESKFELVLKYNQFVLSY